MDPVKTGMKRPMFVPRARGQAGRHMGNASMAGAGPACFVPPCPQHDIPYTQEIPREGLALLSKDGGVVICYTWWTQPICQALCQACPMFTSFHSHNTPILQVRKLRPREVNKLSTGTWWKQALHSAFWILLATVR